VRKVAADSKDAIFPDTLIGVARLADGRRADKSTPDGGYSSLKGLMPMSPELGWIEKFSLDSCWHSERTAKWSE
jgi:hypothetical protein